MNPADDIWAKVIELMKQQGLSPTTIKTWFDDAKAVSLTEDSFTISTPNDYTQSVIKSLYIPKIEAALKELFSMDLKVVVLTEKELENTSAAKQDILFPGTSDYTFERFVVGSSNRYAYSAARAVADIPGRAGYNPLFIYGESGLGKTHLLYAIAHTIHANHPDYKIVYIKGDTFTNELVAAIREGRNQQFREKYREADVFLMDDVQFIAGRESTQEEMFHTFNTLYEAGHQIVFTSDRPPKELLRLDQRLQTRFEQGLPAEGTINKIMAYRDLMGATVDKDTVVRAVKDMFKEKSDILPTADVIIDEVCKFYNIEPTILRGQGRSKDIVLARQIAMYQIRRMTNLSLDEIGQEFSGRDHSTVIHSIRQIEESIKSDSEKAEIVKDITANINSRYE